jgi:hypothetical protein
LGEINYLQDVGGQAKCSDRFHTDSSARQYQCEGYVFVFDGHAMKRGNKHNGGE